MRYTIISTLSSSVLSIMILPNRRSLCMRFLPFESWFRPPALFHTTLGSLSDSSYTRSTWPGCAVWSLWWLLNAMRPTSIPICTTGQSPTHSHAPAHGTTTKTFCYGHHHHDGLANSGTTLASLSLRLKQSCYRVPRSAHNSSDFPSLRATSG